MVRAGLFLFVLWPAMVFFLACQQKNEGQITDINAYIKSIQQWHNERIQRLRQPYGWLSLVGLYWLHPGKNTFGSDSTNDIIFPPQTPPHMGWFLLQDSTVTIHIQPGIHVFHGKKKVKELKLFHDLTGHPTKLTYGTLQWYIIKRGKRFGVRLKDSNSPVRQQFSGIPMFPIDPKWRVKAHLEPYRPPKTIPIPTIIGTIEKDHSPGALVFQWEGKTYRLDAIAEPGDKEWFIIFGDATNGKETYHGGRFLDVPAPDEDGTTWIDFNKAYNPPCVFTPYATCPLPPAQNRLPIAIRAGEKMVSSPLH